VEESLQIERFGAISYDSDTLIPEKHMVRVVDLAIESMNTKPLFARYPGGGSSAYNPLMLLKVVVYAYECYILGKLTNC